MADSSSAAAHFLGTDSMWPNAAEALPPVGACEGDGEEQTFRRSCNRTILAFDAHLRSTHLRHALLWSFEGKSDWGWGHALPMAAMLHVVCRKLHRYCHIDMYDMRLGLFLRYANKLSWAPPSDAERSRFRNVTVVQVDANALMRHPSGVIAQLTRYRAADLVIARYRGAMPGNSEKWLPWWLPMRMRGSHLSQTLVPDRCFNRYFTAPSEALRRQLDARGETHFDAVFHLRTMYADVSPQLNRPEPNRASAQRHAARWLGEACSVAGLARFAQAGVLALSDSPGILQHLRRANPRLAVSAVVDIPAGDSTRSWRASEAAVLATVLDVQRSSLASSAQVSSSGFLKAAAIRSMCLRKLTAIEGSHEGACPEWPRTFVRDLPKYLPLGRHSQIFSSCVERQLGRSHPCKNASALVCRESYLAATRKSLSLAVAPAAHTQNAGGIKPVG